MPNFETIGDEWKVKFPERYKDVSAGELNQKISEGISDPVKRGTILPLMRQKLGLGTDVPDEEVVKATKLKTGSPLDPVAASALKFDAKSKALAAGYDKQESDVQAAKASNPGAGFPSMEARAQQVMTPKEVLTDKSRVQTLDGPDAWERMKRKRDVAPERFKIVNADKWLGNQAVQLRDTKTGNVLAQLAPEVSVTEPDQVEGHMAMARLGGQADNFQQGMAEQLGGIYNPDTGKWLQGTTPPFMEKALAAKGVRTPDQFVGGLPEYAAKVGQRIGESEFGGKMALDAMRAGSKWLAAPIEKGLAKLDEGEAKAALLAARESGGSPAWEEVAKANMREMSKHRGLAQDLSNEAPDTPEARRLAGQYGGQITGELAQAVAPTALSMGVPLAGVVAGKALTAAGRKVAGAISGTPVQRVAEAFGFGSEMATKPATQLAAETAQTAGRNAKQTFERNATANMQQELDSAVFGPLGIAKEADQDKVLKEALDSWHSYEARKAASPAAQKAIEVLQPYHAASYQMLFPDRGKYNPLHVIYGQDITRHPQVLGTYRAQNELAEHAGDVDKQFRAPDVGYDKSAPGMGRLEGAFSGGDSDAVARAVAPKSELAGLREQWLKGEGAPRSEIDAAVKEMADVNALTGIVRTAAKGAESRGLRAQEAFRTLEQYTPQIRAEYPDSFTDVLTWAQKKGLGPEDFQTLSQIKSGQYGDVVGKGSTLQIPEAVRKALKADDNVIVQLGKADMTDVLTKKGRRVDRHVINVPKDVAQALHLKDGDVANAFVVRAAMEMANPKAGEQAAAYLANKADRFLGLAQLNAAITRGVPGFEARNRVGEGMRVAMYYDKALDKKVLREVAELSNGKGRYADVKEFMDSQLGLGRGSLGESLKMGKEAQSPELLYRMGKPGYAAGRALESTQKVLGAPGAASNAAANALARNLWTGTGGGRLAKQYDAADGMKIWAFVSGLEEGMTKEMAAKKARDILMDYGDLSPAQRLAKPLIPFIKYYSSALRGVVETAAKNPRRYSRLNDVMRYLERYDRDTEGSGKSLNAKIRGPGEWLAATPITQEGPDAMGMPVLAGHRWESPAGEAGSLLESAIKEGWKGPMAIASPAATSAMAFTSGKEPSTGRDVIGIKDKDMAGNVRSELGEGNLAALLGRESLPYKAAALRSMWARGKDTAGLLGDNPNATAAYYAALKAPGLSRIVDHPTMQLGLRELLGLGASPAMRSDETAGRSRARALKRSLIGGREQTIDTLADALRRRAAEEEERGGEPRSAAMKQRGISK